MIRQLSYLAPQLNKRGHDISILALYESDRDWERIWGGEPVRVRTLLARKPGNAVTGVIDLIRAVLGLRRILREEKVQILYSFNGDASRFISWLAVSTVSGAKLVWGFQGSSRSSVPKSNSRRYSPVNYINKLVSPFIPLMIANSQAGLAGRMKMGYRCAGGLVINNGFDTDGFKPDPGARERLRREWCIPVNEALIGVIARLDRLKGHVTFLEACSRLLKERKDVRFVFMGDGDKAYRKKLELLSLRLGVSDYLIWVGVTEDVLPVLNSIDVLCSPSWSEGFPNVVGEAMACGKPCVVTDVGDSALIVRDSGVVVPPGDPVLLASGMSTMLDRLSSIDPSKLRRRIAESFTIEKMVDGTEKALQDVFDGG